MLKLICGVFQQRSQFPSQRWKLYREGLEILLGRWENSRDNNTNRIYDDLSLIEKLKLFSEIAATTFEQGKYFFEINEVLQIISNYLFVRSNKNTAPESFWNDSEEILQAIQIQHGLLVERAKGIYSFPHLTFQEYLTARNIVASSEPAILNKSLQDLASRIVEPRWREVILLTANMLPNADLLLEAMKNRVDFLLAEEPFLQQLLDRLDKKVKSLRVPYRDCAVRAFYFGLCYFRDLNLASALDPQLSQNLSLELALDMALTRALTISLSLIETPELEPILNLSFALDLERSFQLESNLARSLHD